MNIDTENWSGEGEFTGQLLEALKGIEQVTDVRVEDAPASRAESGYNFISNEIFVTFAGRSRLEFTWRFGLLPFPRMVTAPLMTLADLQSALAGAPEVGPADYSDEGLIQYLRADRIIPAYQTRGYKLVELVRLYEAGRGPAGNDIL